MGVISVDGYEPKHLSFSTINGYRMCPKQMQLTKILRLEEKPGLAALGGNAVHSVSEWIDLAQFHGIPVEHVAEQCIAEELDNIRKREHTDTTVEAEEVQ